MDRETQSLEHYNETAKYKIAVVSVDELEFLKKNARYMTNDQFRNLVDNIRQDGELSQIPFCVKTAEGKYKVLSGNHRGKAAIAAGLKEIPIIYTEEQMGHDKELAIQLSHNAISGKGDMVILKELYEEIADLQMKQYAGLDDKTLGELSKIDFSSLSEEGIEYRNLSFLFLDDEIDRLRDVIERVKKDIAQDSIYAKMSDYERFLDAQTKIQAAYNVHNGATSVMVILDIFEAHYEDLKNGWTTEGKLTHKNPVPLCSVLGTDYVPAELALRLNNVVDELISKSEIGKTRRYEVLEKLLDKWGES